ncbi:MAG: hypothetical protein IGS48_24255 [Oscillatoriales cyanobacterium C42_A2020_001]|nr:hypothetical protein [Leptolyngbyaceae cyanobacterium C42_A2020_001]
MSKTLTITLPDELEQALIQTATQTNQSAEDIILQLLTQKLIPSSPVSDLTTDPLFQLAGCISSELTDVAENHDYYIGQALYKEMHRSE